VEGLLGLGLALLVEEADFLGDLAMAANVPEDLGGPPESDPSQGADVTRR
jgi:hypothetical protein